MVDANLLFSNFQNGKSKVGVIGLGYVGLPLATLFGQKFKTVGFDINPKRINELKEGRDSTHEIEDAKLILNPNIQYTSELNDLRSCEVLIVAVPTPVDKHLRPDLSPLEKASETVAKALDPKNKTIVVFESTVYPGVTEQVCGKIIEEKSGLKSREHFYLGYSPERVNPGDKQHTIDKITKVVSGDGHQITDFLANLYGSVITAGVFKAKNIKTAEAAKVIENTQRDVNIALINELAMLFHKMEIDTHDVLDAASTKWNFLKFFPGLVGGHCIGVDPYYLTHAAASLGFHTYMIESGRRVNDGMSKFISQIAIEKLLSLDSSSGVYRAAIFGVSFKEDVPDIRNSKVFDLVSELEKHKIQVDLIDDVVCPDDVMHEYGKKVIAKPNGKYDCIILATPHKHYINMFNTNEISKVLNNKHIFMDIKSKIDRAHLESNSINYWRL